MTEMSCSTIKPQYYNSNKKIYLKNNFCYKISNVEKFDADAFAKWMQKGFKNSNLKTLTALADAAKSNKATISRLMTAAAQTTTNKRSQPSRELVERLALIFNENIDDALVLAGHAPTQEYKPKPPVTVAEFYEALKKLGIETKFGKGELEKLPASDLPELLETLITLTLGKIGRTEHGKTFSASDDPRSKAA